MTKKGGVQQLQADLTTDEEFDKFLERPGLLVLDVYSEWCGPCLGMVGSLKKIKLELGGDNLQLAICKSDTISYLKRFNKKSEPTWLFVTGGKATNLMYGTNVPKLMKLITNELHQLSIKSNRPRYAVDELQPEEVARKKVKEDAINEANRKESNERERKRRSYLTQVTDTIMENLPDIGVTVFGPQVNRDMFKKIMEPADALKIQCKDRKVVQVFRENFETINFACRNPLPKEVIEQLHEKELLVCFWKMPDDNRRPLEDVLNTYAHELTKTSTEIVEDTREERVVPGIIAPLEVKFEVELAEGEEPEPEPEPVPPPKKDNAVDLASAAAFDGDDGEEGEEGLDMAMPMPDFDLGLDLDLDLTDDEDEDKAPAPIIIEPPKKRYKTVSVTLPPVWVANNQRTHAALIYVFFRQQTGPFLEPDPVPEPPHVIMAFETYKRRDLLNLADRLKEDIPAYGFFTSDEFDEAKFIASTSKRYAQKPHTPTDRIIFKVFKQTSHTMLAMAKYNPTYCSANTVIGRDDALRLFPEDYQIAEANLPEPPEPVSGKKKKKGKGKGAVPEPEEPEEPDEPEAMGSMSSFIDDADYDGDGVEGGESGEGAEGDEGAEGAQGEEGAPEGEEGMAPPEGTAEETMPPEGAVADAEPAAATEAPSPTE